MAQSANPKTTLVISSLVLLAGGVWLGTKINFAARAREAEGEVSRTYPCRLGRRSGTCGDITYRTEDGFTGTLSGVQGTGPKGTQVDLLYDPKDRNNAQLRGPLKFWFGPLAVMAGALVFLALSVRQMLQRR